MEGFLVVQSSEGRRGPSKTGWLIIAVIILASVVISIIVDMDNSPPPSEPDRNEEDTAANDAAACAAYFTATGSLGPAGEVVTEVVTAESVSASEMQAAINIFAPYELSLSPDMRYATMGVNDVAWRRHDRIEAGTDFGPVQQDILDLESRLNNLRALCH